VIASVLAAGCTDTRPAYREPADQPAGVAMLVGRGGTYIEDVDHARVASAGTVSYEGNQYAGGNRVRVSAGKHRLRAYTIATGGRQSGSWEFNHTFEAGHTYELSPGAGNAVSLQIHDTATGQTIPVN
jgi:hypothetical protein